MFKKKSLCFELEVKEMAFIVCVWHFHSEDLISLHECN